MACIFHLTHRVYFSHKNRSFLLSSLVLVAACGCTSRGTRRGQLKGLSDALLTPAGHRGRHAPVARKRRARRTCSPAVQRRLAAVRCPERVREPGGLGDGARAAGFYGAAVFLATGPTQVEGTGIGTLASAATTA
jgi:hypothetical protein